MNVVNQPLVKHRLGLLNLAHELGNVSQACKLMGVSRDTFYRYQEAKARGGLEALLHKDRAAPTSRIESAKPWNRRSRPMPSNSRPTARCAWAMSCASAAPLSAPPVCAPSGCATGWPTSNND